MTSSRTERTVPGSQPLSPGLLQEAGPLNQGAAQAPAGEGRGQRRGPRKGSGFYLNNYLQYFGGLLIITTIV